METFKKIEGFEDYSISDHGNVRNDKTGKIRKPFLNQDNVYQLGLYKDKEVSMWRIHRLVCNAFIPNPDNKHDIQHIDGDTTNNEVTNLKWISF